MPLTLTHSEIQCFKNCRRKHWWRYQRLYTPKKAADYFTFGTAVHKSLAAFYNHCYEKVDDGTANTLCNGYRDRYYKDHKQWKIVAIEHVYAHKINKDLSFSGRIDLIVRDKKKRIWIVEHKTSGHLDNDYIARLPMDSQIHSYIYLAEKCLKIPIHGVVYNVIRKPSIKQKQDETEPQYYARLKEDIESRPDFYFYRQEILPNKQAYSLFEKRLHTIADEIGRCDSINKAYLNEAQCTMFGRCEFFDICLHGPKKEILFAYDKRNVKHKELQ